MCVPCVIVGGVKGVEGDGCQMYNRSTRQLGYRSQHLQICSELKGLTSQSQSSKEKDNHNPHINR